MKRKSVPFLKEPDTSSHGFTLGLCDSLHAKRVIVLVVSGSAAFPAAGAAHALSGARADVDVLLGPRVSLGAMGLQVAPEPSSKVQPSWDRLEMVWIDAPAVAAQVIDVEAMRDRPLVALVGDPVRVAGLTFHADAAVSGVADRRRPAPALGSHARPSRRTARKAFASTAEWCVGSPNPGSRACTRSFGSPLPVSLPSSGIDCKLACLWQLRVRPMRVWSAHLESWRIRRWDPSLISGR
jgi:hypothetical protein